MVHYSAFEIDSRVQRQARALARRGDEVDLIGVHAPFELRVGEGLIRMHHVRCRKVRGRARAYVRGYGRFFAGALRQVTTLDRRRAFDLVEVHNMPDFLVLTALLPKLRGAPVMLNVHDTFPELFATMFGRSLGDPLVGLMRREERWSAALADAVITVTDEARQRLGSRGVGIRSRSLVVMNSPDERVFGPRREPVVPPAEGPLRVVYHGGLAPRFGVESLVRAIGILKERMPDVQLDVYGSFERVEPLSALVEAVAPEHVHVAPSPTPFELIPDRLAGHHVGVVPTIHDAFTELLLPVKLLEYVHMGIPVVASRLPVIERYFGEDEVRFFEPGSPRSLAEAIADVRAHPEAASERAARASRRLGAYEWTQQRAAYLSMVDELAADRARRA
jgi:glycosyltransferase involved in cell wall biosynthesis